jgi:NAD(P)H-quinone oxidoreductase subunit 6
VTVSLVAFYLLSALTVVCALGVALSHNIVYSAFSLMGTLLGVAAIFVLLSSDFLGVVQLLVYVGGILVLSLFAIMLTHRIADVRVSNRSVGRLPGAVIVGLVFAGMVRVAVGASWVTKAAPSPTQTVYGIGDAFLTTYILPFEIASVLLLVALIGAVVVSRKEIKAG